MKQNEHPLYDFTLVEQKTFAKTKRNIIRRCGIVQKYILISYRDVASIHKFDMYALAIHRIEDFFLLLLIQLLFSHLSYYLKK